MDEPLISIIMGVYNGENTIKKCIDSIISQTYSNWEFIICNDCSTDKTLKILSEYKNKDSRFVILNNHKNLRLGATLNRCLKVANGKYIARMDADDESLSKRLEIQVKFLETHPEIDCIGCNRIMFDGEKDIGIWKSVENPTRKDLLTKTPFAHPTIMMKRSTYTELGGYTVSKDTMRAEDLDLWFRFFANNYKGYNIQRALYRYHESESDLKKRTLKAALGTAKVYLRGYKILNYPIYKYVYAFKPVLSSVIPKKIMQSYHLKIMKKDTSLRGFH